MRARVADGRGSGVVPDAGKYLMFYIGRAVADKLCPPSELHAIEDRLVHGMMRMPTTTLGRHWHLDLAGLGRSALRLLGPTLRLPAFARLWSLSRSGGAGHVAAGHDVPGRRARRTRPRPVVAETLCVSRASRRRLGLLPSIRLSTGDSVEALKMCLSRLGPQRWFPGAWVLPSCWRG